LNTDAQERVEQGAGLKDHLSASRVVGESGLGNSPSKGMARSLTLKSPLTPVYHPMLTDERLTVNFETVRHGLFLAPVLMETRVKNPAKPVEQLERRGKVNEDPKGGERQQEAAISSDVQSSGEADARATPPPPKPLFKLPSGPKNKETKPGTYHVWSPGEVLSLTNPPEVALTPSIAEDAKGCGELQPTGMLQT
jgi:hypothetical protein